MGTVLPPTMPLPSILRGRMIALEVDQITHQALQCRHSSPLQACASFWPGPVPETPHWSASISGHWPAKSAFVVIVDEYHYRVRAPRMRRDGSTGRRCPKATMVTNEHAQSKG